MCCSNHFKFHCSPRQRENSTKFLIRPLNENDWEPLVLNFRNVAFIPSENSVSIKERVKAKCYEENTKITRAAVPWP